MIVILTRLTTDTFRLSIFLQERERQEREAAAKKKEEQLEKERQKEEERRRKEEAERLKKVRVCERLWCIICFIY